MQGGQGFFLGVTYLGRNALRRELFGMMDDPVFMAYAGDTDTPLIWFEINADNKIRLHSPKVEMGQGTFTSLAQMAADELEVPMASIRVVHAQTKTGNIDGLSTGGSTSVAGLWQPLRELSATMRMMLLEKASERLGMDAKDLKMQAEGISGKKQFLQFLQTLWKV